MNRLRSAVLSAVLALSLPIFAQNVGEGVEFIENKTFKEVVARAKAQGKKVFIDCYTSWCGPCKMMATKEFPKKVIGDYMNPLYVSAKFDMEKGEGKDLAIRFDVKAYPTFLVLDSDGRLIDRLVGGYPAEEFITKLKTLGGENSFSVIKKQYDNGDRSISFIKKYLAKLGEAAMSGEAANVCTDLLKGKEEMIMTDTILCQYFRQFLMNPNNEVFQTVYKNRKQYVASLGEDFGKNLDAVWFSYPYRFVEHDGSYDMTKFNEYLKTVKDFKVVGGDKIPQMYAPIIKCSQKNYVGAVAELQKNYKAVKDVNSENVALMNMNIVMRAKPYFKDNAKLIGALKEIIDSRYDFYSKSKASQSEQWASTYKYCQDWIKK